MARSPDHTHAVIDDYLARCVASAMCGEGLPELPPTTADRPDFAGRIAFHGIALLFVDAFATTPGWPEGVTNALRDEARQQVFWEGSHRSSIAGLIEALHAAGLSSIVMKGTALAYSLHANPAVRRRGDTDLLVEHADRGAVREVFRKSGFAPVGDRRALQEVWEHETGDGFVHQVDLHWAISSSMAVSRAFESDHPRGRTVALAALSPNARATSTADALIQTCINRAAHRAFGYGTGDGRIWDGDRLIWAADIDLLASAFTASDWLELVRVTGAIGAAGIVAEGLDFARRTLGTQAPDGVRGRLEEVRRGHQAITEYFGHPAPLVRLRRDLAAASTFAGKAAVLRDQILPGPQFMRERYPRSENWPVAALHARRVLDAGGRMLLGRNR